MKMENDPGLARMYEVLRQYDDGVIRAVAARKAVEIAELRLAIGEDEPTRNQGALLKYLDEDRIVYETVAYILSIPRDRFESEMAEIGHNRDRQRRMRVLTHWVILAAMSLSARATSFPMSVRWMFTELRSSMGLCTMRPRFSKRSSFSGIRGLRDTSL